MKQADESSQVQNECQCIETFLNWHNKQLGTNFSYQRAEDVFPEIAASTRWDFVLRERQHSPWYAAEIKRLIRPNAKIKLVNWNKLLKCIRDDLQSRLQGEFLVYGVPSLNLDRQKRKELKRVLTELIQQNSARLKKGEMVDLGSQILSRFKEWPSTPHLNPNLSPPIEYKVKADSCFTLHKLSDTGCSLELGFAQSGAFLIDQVVEEALTSLFDNREMLQANEQLGLAKQRGAKETILLLDYHLPSWYPNRAKQVLANKMDSSQLADIDCIYLVKATENRVSKVWARV